jgi:signal transduction histidine kinase
MKRSSWHWPRQPARRSKTLRLYSLAQRRQQWLGATAEIITTLSGQVHRDEALSLVARNAREVAEAAVVAVLLLDERSATLTVEAVDAASGFDGLLGHRLDVAGTAFEPALTAHEAMALEDVGKAAAWPEPMPALRGVVAPFADAQGLLLVAYEGEARGADELLLINAFAAQAGLALERARAREDREQLLVVSDRERIARDLHDVVIQRLFASGLQLQTVAAIAVKPELASRINAVVDDLDSTIRDIRGAIFQLRAPTEQSLRAEVRALVDASAEHLAFRPALALDGPIDSAVPDHIRGDLLAVIREALSNVVRHAEATRVDLRLTASGGRVTVVVKDNGKGGATERGGLRNLRERAEKLGGECTVGPAQPSGTELVWSVPAS